jgi:hypothetical protein
VDHTDGVHIPNPVADKTDTRQFDRSSRLLKKSC